MVRKDEFARERILRLSDVGLAWVLAVFISGLGVISMIAWG
jgi:hypothetical protein